jgi:hypothetical protein
MFGSSILEVAIGIVFVYLLLGMVCTMANEWIASVLNQRGRNLLAGIKNLLNDPEFTGLAQQLYNHGLVDGIIQGVTDPSKRHRLPSYISSKTFALALVDILGSRGAAESFLNSDVVRRKQNELQQAQANQQDNPNDPRLRDAVSEAQAALKKAMDNQQTAQDATAKHKAAEAAARQVTGPKDLQAIARASTTLQEALAVSRRLAAQWPNPLGSVQKAVEALPNGHTREALLVLIDKTTHEMAFVTKEVRTGEHQLEALRQNVEHWFNDAADRFTGWYKRWTQVISLIVAAVLVIAANADTLTIANRLARDSALRSSVVTAAESAVVGDPAKNQDGRQKLLEMSENLNLPLGWTSSKVSLENASGVTQTPQGTVDCLGRVGMKLLGLAISILAVSLGAPFWFDTLNKFMNVRSAGLVPPKGRRSTAPVANSGKSSGSS